MNLLLKKLLIIPVLMGLVLLGYGFVNLMDMMKTFESDAWVLPIFTLGLLAVVPIVIFMVARDDIEDPDHDDEDEDDPEDHDRRSD